MEEIHAIIGILLISTIATAGYFAINNGTTGEVTQNYVSCCCNILHEEGYAKQKEQTIVRSQIQMFADNCQMACQRYSKYGYVFDQEGLCALD